MPKFEPKTAHCTVEYDDGTICRSRSMPGAPFPICAMHVRHAYLFARDIIEAKTQAGAGGIWLMLHDRDQVNEQAVREMARFATPLRATNMSRDTEPVVYYIAVDELIKIGTTADLRQRLLTYPPNAQLLATEPGSLDLESVRLQEFAKYRARRREWFHRGDRLMEHILHLQELAA
jgi:hypothetical protein